MAIAEHQYFRLKNGHVLKSLDELGVALREMDDATFHHHVNHERNDFANWTEYVFSEKDLAKKMMHATSKREMGDLILNHHFKKIVDKSDDELKKINEKLENIMWKDFSISKKEDEIEKKENRIEEKIESELKKAFGMRELLYLLIGFSVGIMFMALLKAMNIF